MTPLTIVYGIFSIITTVGLIIFVLYQNYQARHRRSK